MTAKRVKAQWGVVAGIVLVLCAVSIPAHADSVTYNYTYNLISGNSTVGTVTGSFTFNSSTNTLSNATLTINSSLFGNVTLTSVGGSGFVFAFGGTVGGNYILYFITINPLNTSQYWVSGFILNSTGVGGFSGNYTSVPEGGAWYMYLVPSLLVMFGGMLLAGRRPRRVEVLQAA